jgi:glucose-6-phosphate 1-dehydrogenase
MSTATITMRRRSTAGGSSLGGATRPAHYLAIPAALFGTVVQQLAQAGLAAGGRVIVEKPFGTDLASARALNDALHMVFAEPAIFRVDHYLGKRPVNNILMFRFANSRSEPPCSVSARR